jgi:hypothetical protein
MADTVSFYFFSRGVKRAVHRPVKNREERITLENGLNGAQRLNPSIDSGQASGTFGTGASQNSPELYKRSSRDHFLG